MKTNTTMKKIKLIPMLIAAALIAVAGCTTSNNTAKRTLPPPPLPVADYRYDPLQAKPVGDEVGGAPSAPIGLRAEPAVLTGSPTNISVSLIWDPSPGTNVAGYYIYVSGSSGAHTAQSRTNAGPNTSLTVSNMMLGNTYYFVATAYSADALESTWSNELEWGPPNIYVLFTHTNLVTDDLVFRLFSSETPGTNYTLISTVPAKEWRPMGTNTWYVPVAMTPGQRFFRGSLSNLWSESEVSDLLSTPPVLGGNLKLGIQRHLTP